MNFLSVRAKKSPSVRDIQELSKGTWYLVGVRGEMLHRITF